MSRLTYNFVKCISIAFFLWGIVFFNIPQTSAILIFTNDLYDSVPYTFTIDGGGTATSGTNITLQFGSVENQTLTWDITNARFNLSNNLLVNGNLSTNGNTMVLDADNTGGNIVLQFGQSLAKTFTWNNTLSRFDINGSLSLGQNELKNFLIDKLATAPVSPLSGQMYYDTTTNKPYVWNGTSWVDLTLTGGGSSRVVTVGTGQDYATIALAATYLNGIGGGTMLLTAETLPISTTVDLSNITLQGREPNNTIINITGAGIITSSATLFKNLTIQSAASTTATRLIDLPTGATQERFENVRVTIGDLADSLIGSVAGVPPTPTISFSQSEQTGANGVIVPAIASSGLNSSTKIIISNAATNNLLKFNDWPVTIQLVGNALTTGTITPIPANEIKLFPGMNIQGAVNSLPSGGTLNFLAGTYTITAPIQISSSNITFAGSGDGSIISQSGFAGITADTAAIQIGANDGSAPVNNVILHDFKLNVNENIHGIRVTGGDDNQIFNVSVQKVAGTSGSGASAKIGIMILDSSAAVASRPVIRNCRVTGNGGTISFTDGIHVSGDTVGPGIWGYNQGIVSALVEGNNVDYVRETGYLIVNARGSSLFNNRLRRTGVGGSTSSLGIFISRATDVSMVANVLTGTLDPTAQAICIECFSIGGARSTTNSVFTNNLIDGNADSGSGFKEGITVGNASTVTAHRNLIQGNSIVGAAVGSTRAIAIDGDADDNLVSDNTITGGTNAWGTGVTIGASTGERNVIKGQRYSNVTTLINNAGTSTQFGSDAIRTTVDPTNTDDGTKGYEIGATWINTTTDATFILVDSTTSSAIWKPLGSDNSTLLATETQFTEDWISSAVAGNEAWVTTVAGTGAAASMDTANIDSSHPGIVQLSTGTTTTGSANIHLGGANTLAGGGRTLFETLVNIPTLSSAAQEYTLRIGFGDLATGDFVDGVYFIYNRPTSVNWIMGTANNSTRTATPSATAVATGWVKLKAEINAAGTSVNYYINGTSIGSVTTNIPTAAGRVFSPYIQLRKSAGTTARTLLVDYYYFRKEFSTAR